MALPRQVPPLMFLLGEQKANKKVANMQQVKRKMDERREQVSSKRVIKLNVKQKGILEAVAEGS